MQEKNNVQGICKNHITDCDASVFTDIIHNSIKNVMKTELKSLRFYSVLGDGSTDSGNIKEELVYVTYLSKGTVKVSFPSIKNIQNVDANRIKECIESAFKHFDIDDFQDHLVGFHVDKAAVNVGLNGGVGKLLKEKSPWLHVIHCFSHRLELAAKDTFKNKAFVKIDDMLSVLYRLYHYSPKRYRELKCLADAWDEVVPKPKKAYNTRWIDHKYKAMEIVLQNYGSYLAHVESLMQTDSQPLKRAELKGYVNKWKHATYPLYNALYLDILAPLHQLSLAFQPDDHNPVKAIRRIQEFTWAMAKLQMLINESLDKPETILTQFNKLLENIEQKQDQDAGKIYNFQSIKLTNFQET